MWPTQNSVVGPAGRIEVLTANPPNKAEFLAIICHPHPLFGGTLHNKVVSTLERAFRERGAATIRFNFRGVGQSEGSFDQGMGESQDLFAIYQYARLYFPHLPLLLAGFSFGSYVAYQMQAQLNANRLYLIAPPVVSWDFQALTAPQMPTLIVQGEVDEVVDAQAVYEFAGTLPASARLQRMPECSHFFHGKLLELRESIQADLDRASIENIV
jgi:uncharacterized protein